MAIGVGAIIGAAVRRPATRPLPQSSHVVVFGIPGLRLDDLRGGPMPTLRRLADRGGLALLAADTRSNRPSPAEVYASIGASARTRPAERAAEARQVGPSPAASSEAPPAVASSPGAPAPRAVGLAADCNSSAVAVPDAALTRRRTAALHTGSHPGSLGDALASAGRTAGVVGAGDMVGADGRLMAARPAALAVMTSDGCVAAGSVDGSVVLRPDAAAPSGRSVDPTSFAAAVRATAATAAVTVVDAGETERVLGLDPPAGPGAWRGALARTDAALGAVAEALPPDTLLLVAGLDVRGPSRHLVPLVITSAGAQPGRLWSPSTGRRDLVTLADLAPTALHALGVHVPDGMIGRPIETGAGRVSMSALARDDAWARARDAATGRLNNLFSGLLAVAAFLLALLVFGPGGLGALTSTGRVVVTGVAGLLAAAPLASLLTALLPVDAPTPGSFATAVVAIDVALAAVALVAARPAWRAVGVLGGASLAVMVLDLLTGGRLQISTLFGTSDTVAARFHGLGNAGLGIVGGGALVVLAMAWRRRRPGPRAVAGAGAAVLLVAVLPPFGAKVGAALTLGPALVAALFAVGRRRPSVRTVALAAAGLAGLLALAVAVDLVVGRAGGSHLGRLVTSTNDGGDGTLFVTIARKLSTAGRVLRRSTWTVPVVALAAAVFAVGRTPRTRSVLPEGTRTVALLVVLLSALGIAFNDSGILAAATALMLVGAFLLAALLDEAPGNTRGGRT